VGGALSGDRRPSSVCLMSRTSALTRKPKGLGRQNFAQGYPRSHATPTLTSRSKGQKVKSQGHGAGTYCGGHLAAQLVIINIHAFITCTHSGTILNQIQRCRQSLGGQRGKGVHGLHEKASFQAAFEGVKSG